MSRTLSVLIVENFVINEGPKWDKFKKVGHDAKKVPLLAEALGAKGKKQADKSLKERLNIVKSGMSLNEEDAEDDVLEKERESDGHTPESIASLHNVPAQDILDQIEKGIKIEREHTTDKDEARLIAMDHLVELPDYYTRLDKMEEEGLQELEQEKKSLKERLNLVKSGMFLNEGAILTAVAVASLGLASLLTGGLAKLAINMETKSMITDFANNLKNGKDSSVTVNIMSNIVKQKGSKEEKKEFKKLYNELLSLISRGKLELTVATDRKELLDKKVYNVTGFLQKDEEDKKKNKVSDEKLQKAYSLIKSMYEIYKNISDQILQPKEHTKTEIGENYEK